MTESHYHAQNILRLNRHRRRADQKSAAARRCSQVGDGGAYKMSAAAARPTQGLDNRLAILARN